MEGLHPARADPRARGCNRPLIGTRGAADLLDALYRRAGLVAHAARELGLLFRVLAEGGVLGRRRPRLLLGLLLPPVAALGSLPGLPLGQFFLLQVQLGLWEDQVQ